jgi:hypothetical protein
VSIDPVVAADTKRFLEPLRVEFINGREWLLCTSFEYRLGELHGGEFVRVGAGFRTDFASIPRGLWNLWPPTGSYTPAALIHDCLYKTAYVTRDDGTTRTIDRGEADHIFLEAMEVLGVGRFTRWCIHRGVRLGGWAAWKKHRQAAE